MTLVPVSDSVVAVAAGASHGLAIRDDASLWTWGINVYGELGDGTMIDRLWPARVLEEVSAVVSHGHHSLALRYDGNLWSWGADWYGQLRDGTTAPNGTPQRVLDDVVAMANGLGHSLATRGRQPVSLGPELLRPTR